MQHVSAEDTELRGDEADLRHSIGSERA